MKSTITREEFDRDKAYVSKLPLDMQIEFLRDRHEQLTGEKPDTLFPDYSQQAIPVTTEQKNDAPEKTGRLATLLSTGKFGASMAALGAALFTVAACATPPTPTQEGIAAPSPTLTPTPDTIQNTPEGTATPSPTLEPTPTLTPIKPFTDVAKQWISQTNNTVVNVDQETYDVRTEKHEVRVTLDDYFFVLAEHYNLNKPFFSLKIKGADSTTQHTIKIAAEQRTFYLSPDTYSLWLTTQEGILTALPPLELSNPRADFKSAIEEHTTAFLNKANTAFTDNEQVKVLEEQLQQATADLHLKNPITQQLNTASYNNFLTALQQHINASQEDAQQHDFTYSTNDAWEEVKRTLVAANVLFSSTHASTPDSKHILFLLDMYREHRRNNIQTFTDKEGNHVRHGHSDPTSFNSTADMTVLLNYIATPKGTVKEKTEWDFGEKTVHVDCGGGDSRLERINSMPYWVDFDRQTLLEKDRDARTTVIALADMLSFYALPETGLSTHAAWIDRVHLHNTPQPTYYASQPFSTNTSFDPRFSLFPYSLDHEIRSEARRALSGTLEKPCCNFELYTALVGNSNAYWLKHFDILPTRSAVDLEALARGNTNQTQLTLNFTHLTHPVSRYYYAVKSFNVEGCKVTNRQLEPIPYNEYRSGTIPVHYPWESIQTIDNAMERRHLIADLETESRGFALRIGSGLLRVELDLFDKVLLFLRQKGDAIGTQGAFRSVGGVNIYSGNQIFFYPEEREVVYAVAGTSFRLGNSSLKANHELFGMLWLTPEAVARAPRFYPPTPTGPATEPTIDYTSATTAVFAQKQGITVGEPFLMPRGAQLPLERIQGPPYEGPPFPNSASIQRPEFPFFDTQLSAQKNAWASQKYFIASTALLDEGLNKMARVLIPKDVKAQLRGPFFLVQDTSHRTPELPFEPAFSAEEVNAREIERVPELLPYVHGWADSDVYRLNE